MTLILGVDEAGRGPVIGSLFMAGVLVEEYKIKELEKIGVKDSKLLTHKDRIELAKKIKKITKDYVVTEVKPKEIDEAVDGDNSLNLNWLEAEHIAKIINKLNPNKTIIDAPSTNPEKFKEYVKDKLKNKNIKLIAEHKADLKFPSVSAASILAKVAREENVEKIEKQVKESIGSGYPSNKICQEFLKNNYKKYPEIFRKSWATYKKIAGQKNLTDF
ncbi:MAG: ribonuclease HII [Nanoarchaeota archaeon]|nr:ribonuclease HII [Nanoarchaeota archaeon]